MQSTGFISSSDAVKLFIKAGLSESTFRRKVKEHPIQSKLPEGRQRGALYLRKDVEDAISQSRKEEDQRGEGKSTTQLDWGWMKPSDLPAILKLDYEVYKEEMVGDIGLYISWYKKNQNITLLIFEEMNRGNVLAYISLVPLPEETILSVLKGERSELSIKPDEVEAYDHPGEYTLLAESIVVHPQHPTLLNRLLQEVLSYWCESSPEKYLKKIYAQTTSESGDIIVRKFFFSPLYNLADNAYVLDLRKSGIHRVVREYQQHIKDKECA